MNTSMTGFSWFSKNFAPWPCALEESSLSIATVKMYKLTITLKTLEIDLQGIVL